MQNLRIIWISFHLLMGTEEPGGSIQWTEDTLLHWPGNPEMCIGNLHTVPPSDQLARKLTFGRSESASQGEGITYVVNSLTRTRL